MLLMRRDRRSARDHESEDTKEYVEVAAVVVC